MSDLISRQAAIDAVNDMIRRKFGIGGSLGEVALGALPSAQPTLYGYNIEHLELIARVLQKEDFPPERVAKVLKDIGRIVAIIREEFEETLRKAVEQCTT